MRVSLPYQQVSGERERWQVVKAVFEKVVCCKELYRDIGEGDPAYRQCRRGVIV